LLKNICKRSLRGGMNRFAASGTNKFVKNK
jgi:hypothetical protein